MIYMSEVLSSGGGGGGGEVVLVALVKKRLTRWTLSATAPCLRRRRDMPKNSCPPFSDTTRCRFSPQGPQSIDSSTFLRYSCIGSSGRLLELLRAVQLLFRHFFALLALAPDAFALLASAPPALVRTEALAPALLALTPDALVRADAPAPALLAMVPLALAPR